MKRLLTLALCAAAVTLLAGCASDPGKVSKGDLADVRASYDDLTVGMTKEEMQTMFENANVVKLSSAKMLGQPVEEYKIEAFHDDDWAKSRDLFVTFVYLVNDEVVDVSDQRIDFRTNTDVVARWLSETE